MTRAKLRVCTEPGCGEVQAGPRCRRHQSARDKVQRRSTPTKVFAGRDRARRRAAVQAHRARHGDWCPGFGRAGHPSRDLTADHRHEIQAGGDPFGHLDVLCRSCNSRKAQRTQTALRRRVSNGRSSDAAAGVGGTPRGRRGRQPRGRAPKGAEGST